MRFTWTTRFVVEFATKHRKSDDDKIWKSCMTIADYSHEGALLLYTLTKEQLRK